MYYIGVDLGTSSVKLVLMEDAKNIVKVLSKEYPISFPKELWSEQNPLDWYEQTVLGIQELVKDIDVTKVNGISFGGQMHGLVILDENDEVLRPAILWNDGRTGKECDYLNTVVGRQVISKYTGNMALTGFTAPKLLWVKENEAEIFARISKIMLPKDYLIYRFTQIHATDVSDASGMLLFDVEHKCWSEEMMSIVGVKKDQLAKLYESYEVVGNLTESAAKELGLTTLVKVVAGAGDNAAGAIGTGTIEHGMCSVSLGTSGTVFIASDSYAVDDNNALHSFAHANGKYHFLGCMLSAASANRWWMEEILETSDHKNEQAKISKLGENKVFFLPYLSGERTPHNNPYAKGAFIGMSMDTDRSQMTQAVLEGVSYALRDAVEIARAHGITIDRIRITGGGAKSKLWCELIANIMNVVVDKVECEEGPGFGAAILAAVGCKEYTSVEEAAKVLVKVTESIEPKEELVEKYEVLYQKFRTLYPALKDVF